MLTLQSGGAKVMPKNPFTGVTNASARRQAADLVPIVKELHAAGATSLRASQRRSTSAADGGANTRPVKFRDSYRPTASGARLSEFVSGRLSVATCWDPYNS
jgi:hypothetical protein